jgi:ABC-type transporter Mla MlaB component
MTGTLNLDPNAAIINAAELAESIELVRGQEQSFVDRLAPIVRRQSVALDMGSVERIDAAGLAALISLYCDACKAGHSFTIARPGRHVCEILKLVGLDRILLSGSECPGVSYRRVEPTAA